MRIGDSYTGQEPTSTNSWVLAVFVLSLALALTGAAAIWQQQQARTEAKAVLALQAERLQSDVIRRLTLSTYGLKGARGAMAASGNKFNRAAFRAYVASRDLPREFPGAHGFGFIESVERGQLDKFTAAQRTGGAPDFAVRSPGTESPLYVVLQLEPTPLNGPAWGLDAGADPALRQAIEQAVTSGEATLSSPVTLAQDLKLGSSFVMLVPVYRGGRDPGTPTLRRAALLGLLYAPLVPDEVLKGAADASAAVLDLRLSARTLDGSMTPLLATQDGKPLTGDDASSLDLSKAALAEQHSFTINGSEFLLETALSQAAAVNLLGTGSVEFVIGGTMFSVLLAFSAFLLSAGRARAEALAQSMTADLARLATVASRTTNAVIITDAARRITWVNAGFTRITGYTADEVMGLSPGALLRSQHSDPDTVLLMTEAVKAGRACQVEVLNRGKDGRDYWLDIEIQPLLDSTGQLTGFMAIESDITSRKQAELALSQERNRLADILASQTELIFRFAADNRMLFVNEAFCRFFELRADDVLNQPWAPMVHAEDLPLVQQALAQLTPGHPTVTVENRVTTGRGETRWGQFVSRSFFDSLGQLVETQTVARDITQRKHLEAQVQEAHESVQDLYDNAPCAYYSLDGHGRFLQINSLGLSWLGCPAEAVIGKLGLTDFLTNVGCADFAIQFPNLKTHGRLSGVELDLIGGDGKARRVSVSATAIYDSHGQFLRTRSAMFDITETDRIRQQLHQLTQDQQAMLETDLVGIAKAKNRRTTWRNRALEAMFGYAEGELIDAPTRLLYADDASYDALVTAASPALKMGQRYRTQLRMRRKDGSQFWVDLSGSLLPTGDGTSLWLMVDISHSKAHEERMERAALHDPLSGLPNRLLLADRLNQALQSAQRSGHQLTLAYMDLNGFKQINDTYGHDAGDEVLKVVAARLQSGLRATDTVARLGGDEFVVLLSPTNSPAEAEPVLSRLLDMLIQPITLTGGVQVAVGSSLGVAHYPAHGRVADALMQHADQAMYVNKRAGKMRRQSN